MSEVELSQRWKNIEKSIEKWRTQLYEAKGARTQLVKNQASEQEQLLVLRKEQDTAEKASLFLAAEIIERRQQAINNIESIGTSALRMIYGPDYSLEFETFDEKRDKGEKGGFKMAIQVASDLRGQKLRTGLMGERGGGVIEASAFGLRTAALDWMNYNGPMILDEAWKSMSADEKLDAVADFLREYIDATGRQTFLATHRADVFGKHADNIIRIEKEDGIAKASTITYDQILAEIANMKLYPREYNYETKED